MMEDYIYSNYSKQSEKEYDMDLPETTNIQFNYESDPDEKDSTYKIEAMKLMKWNKMVHKLDEYLDKSNKTKYKKLKERTKRGIPECFRGYIWQVFGGVDEYRNTSSYFQMLTESRKQQQLTDAEKEILKDLDRTIPNSTFFKDKYGLGQRSLFHVLSTFSRLSTETGYVQGMSFFTASLLNHMDEESAFWMLYIIMEKYKINGFFKKDFPELNKAFYKLLCLLRKISPRIYECFKSHGLCPSMYASQWFLTLFFVNVKYEFFLRIFDLFLLERNSKIIYRFGLALLKLNEEKIVNTKLFDELMIIIKHLDDKIDVEKLCDEAMRIKISSKALLEYEKQYENLRSNNMSDEILDQSNFNEN